MEPGKQKQLIIGAIYVTIFLLIAWGIYSILKPEPSCKDGKKNQNEEGVDCGGVCPDCPITTAVPLRIISQGHLPSGPAGAYDAWAYIENPNQTIGSSYFSYILSFKNEAGTEIGRSEGKSYILPAEKKYILATNIFLPQAPAKVTLETSEPKWVELVNYTEQPALEIVNKRYNEISSGSNFSELIGLLKNESPFDFHVIEIKIILKDASGQVIALNSTEMGTVRSSEEREFRALWPVRFSGDVRTIEAQPDVNVFDLDAFARRYYKPERFQQIQ